MGLGKTVVSLTAIAKLMDRCEVYGVLVVAPLRVCELVWPQQVAKWDHTRHLKVVQIEGAPAGRRILRQADPLIGGDPEETTSKPSDAALKTLSEPADIFLINYEILPELCKWMTTQKTLPFNMVVFDESTKMKSASAKRFKLFKPHVGRFDRRVVLAGRPAPQGYEDLWSQIYLLDQGKRLGTFITHFRSNYFDADRYSYDLTLKEGAADRIERKIADLVLCLRAEDHLKMPQLIFNKIEVKLPAKVMKQYKQFEDEMFLKLKTMSVEALNAASLSIKCRQLTSGAVYSSPVYDKDGKLVEDRKWEAVHDAKLDALEEVLDEANGSPVLVVYEFQSEIARLRKRWPNAPWIGGGAAKGDTERAVENWNRGKVPFMFVHPDSIGHGVNLQDGGHIQVWTSGTWNLDLWDQTIARLHRQGQKHPVIVHSLIVPGTVDVAVASAIKSKATGQKALIANLIALRNSAK
jgi:SNF2 family DNA or RNA helicase